MTGQACCGELRNARENGRALDERWHMRTVMSHELKNPLNLIPMNAELIGRTPEGSASPKLARAVDIIRRTVRTQSQIIDDLLDLSRLHTGKLALTRTAVPGRPVVERILEGLRQEAISKGVDVSSEIEDPSSTPTPCAWSRSSGTWSAMRSSSRRAAGASSCAWGA